MDLVTSHKQDLKLLRDRWDWAGLALILVALAGLPLFASEYVLYIASLAAVMAIGTLGQNLLIGYAGQISLGQVGFIAVGAYAHAHAVRAGVPFVLSLLLSGTAGMLAGLIVGIPSLRLKGPYLAIATLGFGVASAQILTNWELVSGGRMGLSVPPPTIAGLSLGTVLSTYYAFTAVGAIIVLMGYQLTRSYVGRAFVAIRDSDVAAEVLGVNLARTKLLAFGLSSFLTAIQGALWGQLLGFLEPQMFTFMESVSLLAAVIIGGIGTVPGSVFGAVFVVLVPQLLSDYREWVPVLFGVAMILIMIFEPLGLYGRWMKLKYYMKNWPFR